MASCRDDMESLAYCILRLLRGFLPWPGDQCTAAVKGSRTGPALCGAYLPVFGAFGICTGNKVRRTAGLRNLEGPVSFLGLGAGRVIVIQPSNTTAPLVGSILGSGGPSNIHVLTPPLTNLDDDSLLDSDDHFVLTSEWPAPSRVKTEDLLGDERKVMTDALEMFDEPPKMKWPYLDNDDLEILRDDFENKSDFEEGDYYWLEENYRPDDGYFKNLYTEQLINLVKRMLRGPKAWGETPSQSEHHAAPRAKQTVVRRAVNKLRKFIRKPLWAIDEDPDGSWVYNRPKLLPGGKYVLFQNSGCVVECWSVFEDRRIWTHVPSMDHTVVDDFEVDMMEDDIAIILTCQRTDPGQHFIEITTLNLKTEISDLKLLSRLPQYFYSCLCVITKCSSSTGEQASAYDCQIAPVPDRLLVLTRTGTRGENRVALSPFALFECWEPNDSMEQPLTPVVPVADLPFLPDTFSLTCEPSHAWLRSIWGYESPFERGRFTVWLHDWVNAEPALLNFQFVKHATRVSWRFLSSTVMLAPMYPTTMSLSGHTLGYCRGYDDFGIFPPFPVNKGSARHQIVDLGGSYSVHMSSFSGALTYSTATEVVIIYYD
ncbi:hypothetical protein DFH08DRAFT_983431 [Mycena albidolilacea]|uniref:Uncharacterized protein n=1 Tax=Mycena albidolilacea TaxID=1033008 RepID=A0AAD7AW41_9AGAR|nr:hypothetical protein DFH08DRAFT_983431 [Mycena albidolilacea]